MPAIIDILIFSMTLSLILTLSTKFLTNQKEVKEIKRKTAEYRKQIKEAQKAGNPGEVKRLSEEMFKTSKKQFKYSTKSMFVSMIIVIVAFGWLQGSYDKININFSSTNTTNSSSYGTFKYKGIEHTVETGVGQEVHIDKKLYTLSEFIPFEDVHLKASTDANKPIFSIFAARSPVEIPYLGTYLSWFWLYVLITIPSTMIFRKLLDVE